MKRNIFKAGLAIAHFVSCCAAWCVGNLSPWLQQSYPFVIDLNERIDNDGSR